MVWVWKKPWWWVSWRLYLKQFLNWRSSAKMYWRIRGSLQIAPYSKVIFIWKNLPSPTFKFHGGNMLQWFFLAPLDSFNLCRSFRVAHGWKPTSSDVGLRVRTAYLQPELCTCAAFFLHSRNRENVSRKTLCVTKGAFFGASLPGWIRTTLTSTELDVSLWFEPRCSEDSLRQEGWKPHIRETYWAQLVGVYPVVLRILV